MDVHVGGKFGLRGNVRFIQNGLKATFLSPLMSRKA